MTRRYKSADAAPSPGQAITADETADHLVRVNAQLAKLATWRMPGLDAVCHVYHPEDIAEALELGSDFLALRSGILALEGPLTPEKAALDRYQERLRLFVRRGRVREAKVDPVAAMRIRCEAVRKANETIDNMQLDPPPDFQGGVNRLWQEYRRRFAGKALPPRQRRRKVANRIEAVEAIDDLLRAPSKTEGGPAAPPAENAGADAGRDQGGAGQSEGGKPPAEAVDEAPWPIRSAAPEKEMLPEMLSATDLARHLRADGRRVETFLSSSFADFRGVYEGVKRRLP